MDLIKIVNQQGQHRKKLEKANREKILNWVIANPNTTMKQCGKDLGLSHVTVRKHMREIGVK